jgi:type IV secretory pathway TraG/TraD family ATPase VirD4
MRRWSAKEWSKTRSGWLFLTSTPETRERLLPLTGLWLDTLVLRLMKKHDDPTVPKVWFLLDELATLRWLPQLHTAVTENRKSNNPVVLGFQGRSQLEARYGHEAEAMLSQPATKIFLRTSEPNAAEWISRTIGGIETERLKESRSSGQFGSQRKSTSEDNTRQIEPLVMDSEISGLPDLHGYVKCGNYVVRMSFTVISLSQRHAGFIRRPTKTEPEEMALTAAATVGTSGSLGRRLEPREITHSQERQLQRGGQRHFFQ